MAELVAVQLAGWPLVETLQRCWDRGECVAPLDPRLPPTVVSGLLDDLGPTAIVDGSGRRRLTGGTPADDGDALVLMTGGTTGTPKGVVLNHEAVVAAARITSTALSVEPGRDRWLACLPLNHAGGLGVVTRALLTGTRLEVHEGFDPSAVQSSDANLTALVPTMLGRVETGGFRAVLVGGDRPPEQLPSNVVTTYGLTETYGGVVYDGRPLAGVEVRVVEERIEIRSPTLLRCYRHGEIPVTDDGWLPTGDLGALSADGRLHVHGRSSEVIVTGGENVWPRPVEEALHRVPWIAEAAVAGRPDPEWGEIVVAHVVARPGEAPSLERLRSELREHLPPWALPRAMELHGSLPRTVMGKLRRGELDRGTGR